MKKTFTFAILTWLFSIHAWSNQKLVEQIKEKYMILDTATYINDLVHSYEIEIRKEQTEIDNALLELYGYEHINLDSIRRQYVLDSIYVDLMDSIHNKHYNHPKKSIEEKVKDFTEEIRASSPVYVLNLITLDELTLQPDTGKLSFNLFFFDEDYKGRLYVFCENGRYCGDDSRYRTFSKKLGINAPKIFKKTMRKHPQCILYCNDFEGMNTILYMLNDKIYVCRITEKKEYELNDFIKKFGFPHREILKKLRNKSINSD